MTTASTRRITTYLAAITVLLSIAGVVTTAEAVPASVSFAGRLRTSNGPVTGTVSLGFALYPQATAGVAVWSETHPGVTAAEGLVYADLGALTTLDEAVFDGGALYLEITVSGETLAPRLPVRSVPYAIRAHAADSADTLGTIGPGDVVTAVSGAGGVTATRSGNQVALGVNTGVVQARVTGTCSGANQSIKTISATGAATCETDDNTTYTAAAGSGVALSGTAFGLTTCASGQVLKSTGGGGYGCQADSNTTYSAGAGSGVKLTGTTFGLTTCASGQVLKAGSTAGSWACATDANSGGTITGITTAGGSGLTGGTSSGNAGLAVAAGGITSTHLASGAVTMTKTDAPIGYAGPASATVTTPLTFISAGSFVASTAGYCVIDAFSDTGETDPSGAAALGAGYKVGSTLGYGTIGGIFAAAPGTPWHSAASHLGFAVSAGQTYQVGCVINFLGGGGTFVGNNFRCAATWVCN